MLQASLPRQDPIDYVNHLHLEMDSRNPRTRLAVIGMLIENKAPATRETLELAQEIAAWIGSDVDNLLTDYLEDALNNFPEEEEVEKEPPRKGAYL